MGDTAILTNQGLRIYIAELDIIKDLPYTFKATMYTGGSLLNMAVGESSLSIVVDNKHMEYKNIKAINIESLKGTKGAYVWADTSFNHKIVLELQGSAGGVESLVFIDAGSALSRKSIINFIETEEQIPISNYIQRN